MISPSPLSSPHGGEEMRKGIRAKARPESATIHKKFYPLILTIPIWMINKEKIGRGHTYCPFFRKRPQLTNLKGFFYFQGGDAEDSRNVILFSLY